MRQVRWERMFPDQLEQAFARCPLLYFPYGLCEPHGPHNTLGLDALKAHAICCQAAHAHGGIVAPPDYWHIHECGTYACWLEKTVGQQRAWLTAMPPWQHFKNVIYHMRAADNLQFHAAILFTGHYGPNWRDLRKMVQLIQPYVGTRLAALPDFEANLPGFDNDNKSGGDHAGKVETSLLWALEPQCVDVSRFPPPDAPFPQFAMGRDARLANRTTGERMVADEVRYLGNLSRDLLEAYDREKPRHTLRTYEDVERLWDSVIRPEFHAFETMHETRPGDDPPPPNSIWYPNWRIPPGH